MYVSHVGSLLPVLVLARCILLTLLARVSSVLVLLLLCLCFCLDCLRFCLDRHVLLLSWRHSDLLGGLLGGILLDGWLLGGIREKHLGYLLNLTSATCGTENRLRCLLNC